MCNQGIEREGDVAAEDLKGNSTDKSHQNLSQVFMEAWLDPIFILQLQNRKLSINELIDRKPEML